MAEELVDPREVAWHPRHAQQVVGHQEPKNRFEEAFKSGRPHHAWLMTGPTYSFAGLEKGLQAAGRR